MRKTAFLFVFCGVSAANCQPWLEMVSPDFEVYTNAGEGAARRVLQKLDQIQRTLEGATHIAAPAGTGVRVFVFSGVAEFKSYSADGPGADTAGFYHQVPGRDDIVIREAGRNCRARSCMNTRIIFCTVLRCITGQPFLCGTTRGSRNW